MGDPKFPSKHYDTPSHPWQKVRMENESGLIHQYGLRNKKEIWKANTKVREMRRQARKLTAQSNDGQAQKEKVLLLAKLGRLGMLEENSGLEDILRMTPENILDRRLQTQVYLQGMASTIKQARQLITHGHISVEKAVVRIPSMLVTKLQEKSITYSPNSALNSDLHPVRPSAKDPFANDELGPDETVEEKAEEEKIEDEPRKVNDTSLQDGENK